MISRILMALAGFGIVMIVIRAVSGGAEVPATPDVTTNSPAPAAAFFPASEQESASISVARYKDESQHVAFTGYDGPTKDKIYYATCEGSDCGGNPDQWSKAEIAFAGAQKVQLALTSDGRPRLYVISYAAAGKTNYNRTYSYGECDSGCTDAANWKFTEVADSGDNLISEVLGMRIPDRTFVVDGLNRPRFIYTDANYAIEPDHYGAFVMSCDADCTKKANWTEADLALHLGYQHEQFTKPVLAAAKDGSLGVAANVYAFDVSGKQMKQGLYFYGCKADCTVRSNWTRAFVNETGSGSYPSPTWDLALTSDGKPRIAQFAGAGTERKDLALELIYLWCNSGCSKEENWSGAPLQPGNGIGESADLVLDDDGRPRIAMLTASNEAALAACDADCESSAAKWRFSIAEPITAPQKERPKALPFHCDGEIWQALMPSLSVNGDTATVGYDMLVSARCIYKYFQEPVPSYTFHEIFHGTRIVQTKLPE
ncbi:hypothetical protein [Rhizobium sp.]